MLYTEELKTQLENKKKVPETEDGEMQTEDEKAGTAE